ncbi:MAG: T9SS type A sorting domain-containing protein [Candidatus Latescibacteria bacterium]|nr:T9SS type A sorting domain-containing protein [bacterium]MBD3424218.1 T9SS type A sorting domain-containing protein [Candidatus Latescibacterota bacterium]
MNRKLLLFLCALLAMPADTYSQFRIPAGVFTGSGGARGGSHYLYDSAGQAGADHLTGASNQIRLGFWYMAGLESAVEVAISALAGRYRDDAVELSWSAHFDSPVDGFNIYRAEDHRGVFERINSELILPAETCAFIDRRAIPGRSYSYYISAVAGGTETVRSLTITLELPPKPAELYQNYPNPFNPSTVISFFMPERADVSLKIYDTEGRRVRTLVSGIRDAGRHSVKWNGSSDSGESVSSGIYFCRFRSGRKEITRKLVLMR